MIQRIQTVYLLQWVALSVLCVYFECTAEHHPWALTAIMCGTGVLELLGIFLFRQRALQMRLCIFCIILLVGWYLALVAFAFLLGDGLVGDYRPEVWAAIPAVNAILLYLAFRGILHDDLLVRSLDRLR